MAYFPFFVNLEGKRALVIGGGAVAARRVRVLLEFGCEIQVIAPKLGTEMQLLLNEVEKEKGSSSKSLTWICENYHKEVLYIDGNCKEAAGYVFVLAAALPEINRQVAEDCHQVGLFVNDASRKENCDFYFPGIIKEEEVVIGVTASGSDHRRVAALTADIRNMLREQKEASIRGTESNA